MPRKIQNESPYATYPQWFWRIADAMQKRQSGMTADVGPRNKAINFRQRFHLFRRQLMAERHPWAEECSNYTLSLEEGPRGTAIVFTRNEVLLSGVDERQNEQAPVKSVPPRERSEGDETPMTQQEHEDQEDHFENAVNRWLKGEK